MSDFDGEVAQYVARESGIRWRTPRTRVDSLYERSGGHATLAQIRHTRMEIVTHRIERFESLSERDETNDSDSSDRGRCRGNGRGRDSGRSPLMNGRRDLLVTFAVVGTAGCLEPPVTGSPPSRPRGSFEFDFRTVDGAELVRIAATNVSGDPSGVRVRIGDTIAYTDEGYGEAYTASRAYVDEWDDGIDSGDVLELTSGDTLPENERLSIEVEGDESGEYVTIGETRITR